MSFNTKSKRPSLHTTLLANQQGKINTLAMILCLFALLFYFKIGRAHFLLLASPLYDTLVSSTLVLVSLFAIGCELHMIALGDLSGSSLRKDAVARAEKLAKLASYVSKQLAIREQQCCIQNGSLSTRTIRALSMVKRISTALQSKSMEVEGLLARGSHELAYELLCGPLQTDGDCYNQLILGEPIAPLSDTELKSTLTALFHDIDYSLAPPQADWDEQDNRRFTPTIILNRYQNVNRSTSIH